MGLKIESIGIVPKASSVRLFFTADVYPLPLEILKSILRFDLSVILAITKSVLMTLN